MRKSLTQLDYIPASVGLLVGVGDGIIATKITTAHARTYYRGAVAAAGFVADHMNKLHPDISIGMMTASATLIAQGLMAKVEGAATTAAPQFAAPAQLGGRLKDIPAEQTPTQAGYLRDDIPGRQTATNAGYLRDDIPGRQAPTKAGYLGNKNFMASGKPATQRSTIAG